MMKTPMENKELKLHTDLAGHKAGETIRVKCKDGIPVDRYWRNRIEDSAIDGCVSVVEKNPEPEVVLETKTETKTKSGKKE